VPRDECWALALAAPRDGFFHTNLLQKSASYATGAILAPPGMQKGNSGFDGEAGKWNQAQAG